ncbi:hypothetical protein [Pseudoalteromonas sp. S2755]|uniref:hypothetical protein n=1 Tax=Pseudoalteromonas sp. S2755 TaxID=2066523 RepID=UPI00110A15FD|nr:hypothetical protein [Pseudoalteromonas sp. S2755]TMN46097.1 hypothetical protein CWC03_00495 [Pseudoalteromonas sp. S2755]
MNISNTQAIYGNYNAVEVVKKQNLANQNSLSLNSENRESNTNGLDMRNVSQEDIRTLAKVTGDDRVWQYIPFEEFEFKGDTLVGVENKDYLGALERRIEYNRSIGQPTKGYEETLAVLKSYQGYILPKKISVTA